MAAQDEPLVTLLRGINGRSVIVEADGTALHLLTFEALDGDTATFGIDNDTLSALILRLQALLSAAIQHQFNVDN